MPFLRKINLSFHSFMFYYCCRIVQPEIAPQQTEFDELENPHWVVWLFHGLTVEHDREKVNKAATANPVLPSICARSSAG